MWKFYGTIRHGPSVLAGRTAFNVMSFVWFVFSPLFPAVCVCVCGQCAGSRATPGLWCSRAKNNHTCSSIRIHLLPAILINRLLFNSVASINARSLSGKVSTSPARADWKWSQAIVWWKRLLNRYVLFCQVSTGILEIPLFWTLFASHCLF